MQPSQQMPQPAIRVPYIPPGALREVWCPSLWGKPLGHMLMLSPPCPLLYPDSICNGRFLHSLDLEWSRAAGEWHLYLYRVIFVRATQDAQESQLFCSCLWFPMRAPLSLSQMFFVGWEAVSSSSALPEPCGEQDEVEMYSVQCFLNSISRILKMSSLYYQGRKQRNQSLSFVLQIFPHGLKNTTIWQHITLKRRSIT